MKSCNDCGRPFEPRYPRQSRCPLHDGGAGARGGWSHNRDRRAQAAFRAAVLERDGYRCKAIDEDTGERCTETEDLRACHVLALVDGGGYDVDNGVTRCREHDRATDPKAR